MGCSNSKGPAASVKTNSQNNKHRTSPKNTSNVKRRSNADGPLQGVVGEDIPHVSISELGNQDDHDGSIDSSGGKPYPKKKSKKKNSSTTQRPDSSPAAMSDDEYKPVTKRSLSELKRLRTGDKVRTWQRAGDTDLVTQQQEYNYDASPVKQRSAPPKLNGGGGGAAPQHSKTSLSLQQQQETTNFYGIQPTVQRQPHSTIVLSKGSAPPPAAAGQGDDDGSSSTDSAKAAFQWERQISALASRRQQHSVALTTTTTNISAPYSSLVLPQATAEGQGGDNSALLGNTTTTAMATTTANMSPLLAQTMKSSNSSITTFNATQQQQQQQKFVVVAKVNNPTTGINLVYRRSDQVIGVGSSATVYLGSVTTTITTPAASASGNSSNSTVATAGAAATTTPTTHVTPTATTLASSPLFAGSVTTAAAAAQQQQRKFLTAVKEILVSPPAILMESPSGEQLTTKQKATAVSAIRTTQDVVQMLRLEFRLLKSLDACPQVVRVLHVAVTSADAADSITNGGGAAAAAAASTVADSQAAGGGGDLQTIGAGFPTHFRPQKARMFLEYVRHGTLAQEVRRMGSLFHIPDLSQLQYLHGGAGKNNSDETSCDVQPADVPIVPPLTRDVLAGRNSSGNNNNAMVVGSPASSSGIASSNGLLFPQPPALPQSLAAANCNASRLHELTVRAYMRDVLLGLAYLHEHHCIHRDVKPHNILVHSLVEEMFDTYFPICLDDDVVKFSVPSPVDSDADNFEEAYYKAPQVMKRPSYVSNLLTAAAATAAAQQANVGGQQLTPAAPPANQLVVADSHNNNNKAAMPQRVDAAVPPSETSEEELQQIKKAQQRLAEVEAIVAENEAAVPHSKRPAKVTAATTLEQQLQSGLVPFAGKHRGSHYALDDLIPVTQQEDNDAPIPPSQPAPLSPSHVGGGGSLRSTVQVVNTSDDASVTKTIHKRSHKYHHANHRQKQKTLIKLSDFGSARWTIPTDAEHGEDGAAGYLRDTVNAGCKTTMNVVGTAPYMAPEAIRGKFTTASDIWSFAITFLEMLLPVQQHVVANNNTSAALPAAGGAAVWQRLGARDSFQLILQIAALEEPHHLPHIPHHLSPEGRDMLRRCFAMRPSDRPSAVELLNSNYFASTSWVPQRLSNHEMEPMWHRL